VFGREVQWLVLVDGRVGLSLGDQLANVVRHLRRLHIVHERPSTGFIPVVAPLPLSHFALIGWSNKTGFGANHQLSVSCHKRVVSDTQTLVNR